MKSRGIRREDALFALSIPGLGGNALPDCPEDRECCKSCHAYRNGKCGALRDVHFKNNTCPFYKDREQARQERIEGMARLEDEGRDDLINKYYKNYRNFSKILANELVGIAYEYDDDNYGDGDEDKRGPGRPRKNTAGMVAGNSQSAESAETEDLT